MDSHLYLTEKTIFDKAYVELLDISFVDEDGPTGRRLLTQYAKPINKRRFDLGRSHLIKATFYIGSVGSAPALVTVLNRCYGMTKKSDRSLVASEYRRRAHFAPIGRGAKLPYRLGNITLLRENWDRPHA